MDGSDHFDRVGHGSQTLTQGTRLCPNLRPLSKGHISTRHWKRYGKTRYPSIFKVLYKNTLPKALTKQEGQTFGGMRGLCIFLKFGSAACCQKRKMFDPSYFVTALQTIIIVEQN